MTLTTLSAVKKLLIFNFVFLLLFQIFVGFKELDDYLVIFVFALFLNDLYFKLTKPMSNLYEEQKSKRIWMTLFLVLILLVPVFFELFHVKNATQSFVCKVGFILWAQAFLLDSFLHYRETNSKKWLLFANVGGIFIVFFSIAI
jgi:hypothetical protein